MTKAASPEDSAGQLALGNGTGRMGLWVSCVQALFCPSPELQGGQHVDDGEVVRMVLMWVMLMMKRVMMMMTVRMMMTVVMRMAMFTMLVILKWLMMLTLKVTVMIPMMTKD